MLWWICAAAALDVQVWLGAAVVLLSAVGIATRKTVATPGPLELPLVQGSYWLALALSEGILNGVLRMSRQQGWRTWTIKWPFSPRYFFVLSPDNVEHMLKTKFANYEKGSEVAGNLRELMGQGIFAADGEVGTLSRIPARSVPSHPPLASLARRCGKSNEKWL